jgi:hypothetical protein
MTRRTAPFVLVLGIAAVVASFGLTEPQEADPAVPAPASDIEILPWDVATVIGASVLVMRGVDDPNETFPVIVAPEAAAGLQEPDFRYAGFVLSGATVTDYRESVDPPESVSLGVVLGFVDAAGRRATVSLFVDYEFSGDSLSVGRASALPLGPDVPEVRLFVVPVEAVPADAFRPETTLHELLSLAAANDVANRTGGETTLLRDYYLLGFVVDRLWPDAAVEL